MEITISKENETTINSRSFQILVKENEQICCERNASILYMSYKRVLYVKNMYHFLFFDSLCTGSMTFEESLQKSCDFAKGKLSKWIDNFELRESIKQYNKIVATQNKAR